MDSGYYPEHPHGTDQNSSSLLFEVVGGVAVEYSAPTYINCHPKWVLKQEQPDAVPEVQATALKHCTDSINPLSTWILLEKEHDLLV